MPVGASNTDVLVEADQGVPPGLIHDLETIVSKLREYSGNPKLWLVVRRGSSSEYQITISGHHAETTFCVADTSNILDDVHKKLLGSAN